MILPKQSVAASVADVPQSKPGGRFFFPYFICFASEFESLILGVRKQENLPASEQQSANLRKPSDIEPKGKPVARKKKMTDPKPPPESKPKQEGWLLLLYFKQWQWVYSLSL
jgi:hypothetical protein